MAMRTTAWRATRARSRGGSCRPRCGSRTDVRGNRFVLILLCPSNTVGILNPHGITAHYKHFAVLFIPIIGYPFANFAMRMNVFRNIISYHLFNFLPFRNGR
ncbi:hypothetical protein KM92DES2_10175 [uncultured Desulfovibrio sp.]|uniref:Uncharacterized protein n=1 Tax=uncultured Desulfovibrio sp. TaxID=167968 RepID=A0A212IX04_9BACT|nr:hypothetical protein KM92DES2_10175 [uncultured Desulfovibrio sp.]